MRLKLDENLGWRIAESLRDAGHDVATVRDEELGGADDDALFARCLQEGRCLDGRRMTPYGGRVGGLVGHWITSPPQLVKSARGHRVRVPPAAG